MAAPSGNAGFFVNADPVLRATKEKAEKGDKASALKLYIIVGISCLGVLSSLISFFFFSI